MNKRRDYFVCSCSILSELYTSIQKTLDEDRLQLTCETIDAILNYKKSLSSSADQM